ncbi:MAG: UbiA family prenyltransferase [Pirellulales bacterium]
MVQSISAWLQLLRLPNYATAVADVLSGYLICFGPRIVEWPEWVCWSAMASSVSLYAAGMVLNDVYDVEVDRIERPERPLPSGLVSLSTAHHVGCLLFGVGLLFAGITSLLAQSVLPIIIGILLVIAVWVYDRYAKKIFLGPVVMGMCRGLNWLLGMTAVGEVLSASEYFIPMGMSLYVCGITLFAKDEAGRSSVSKLTYASLVMLMGLIVAGLYPLVTPINQFDQNLNVGRSWILSGQLSTWLMLWTLLSAFIIVRNIIAITNPTPLNVQYAVGNAIMSIITLDAVLVLASCGELWSIVVLLLLVPFHVGRYYTSPT